MFNISEQTPKNYNHLKFNSKSASSINSRYFDQDEQIISKLHGLVYDYVLKKMDGWLTDEYQVHIKKQYEYLRKLIKNGLVRRSMEFKLIVDSVHKEALQKLEGKNEASNDQTNALG